MGFPDLFVSYLVIIFRSCAFNPTPMTQAEKRRLEAQVAEARLKAQLRKIMTRYGTNKSGKLERDQVIKFLTETDSSTPKNTPPTDEQVDFLLKVSDKDNSESIGIDELGELMAVWKTFMDNRTEFEEKLAKYDKS